MSDNALIADENRRYKQLGLLLLGFEKHNSPKMGVDRDYARSEPALLSPFTHSEKVLGLFHPCGTFMALTVFEEEIHGPSRRQC